MCCNLVGLLFGTLQEHGTRWHCGRPWVRVWSCTIHDHGGGAWWKRVWAKLEILGWVGSARAWTFGTLGWFFLCVSWTAWSCNSQRTLKIFDLKYMKSCWKPVAISYLFNSSLNDCNKLCLPWCTRSIWMVSTAKFFLDPYVTLMHTLYLDGQHS
jgi:hypothetical protein